jgi:hypothetical protein
MAGAGEWHKKVGEGVREQESLVPLLTLKMKWPQVKEHRQSPEAGKDPRPSASRVPDVNTTTEWTALVLEANSPLSHPTSA